MTTFAPFAASASVAASRISRFGCPSSLINCSVSMPATFDGRNPSSCGGFFMRIRQMRPLPWTGYDLSTQSLK